MRDPARVLGQRLVRLHARAGRHLALQPGGEGRRLRDFARGAQAGDEGRGVVAAGSVK